MAVVLHDSADGATDSAIRQQHHRGPLHQTERLLDSIDCFAPEHERLLDVHSMLTHIPKPPSFIPCPLDERDAAMKVFEVSELADGIFVHLDILDLIRLRRTNTRLHTIVQESDIALRRMFLLPDLTSSFAMLDQCLERYLPGVPTWEVGESSWESDLPSRSMGPLLGVEVMPDGDEAEQHLSFVVRFRAADLRDTHKALPSSLRRLYLCQPPVNTVNIHPSCQCYTFHGMIRSPAYTRSDATNKSGGFTLGDMLDAARDRSAAHRLCPYAATSDHDSQGNVRVDFTLTAKLHLGPDDPLNQLWSSRLEKAKRSKKVDAAKEALFGAYSRCKHNAAAADDDRLMPTFAEWQDEHMRTIAEAEADGFSGPKKSKTTKTKKKYKRQHMMGLGDFL